MKQNENGAKIASIAEKAINEFYETWYNNAMLYRNLALAYGKLHDMVNKYGIKREDVSYINRVLDQCMMLTELVESIRIGEKYER